MFKHLSICIIENLDPDTEIKEWIEQAVPVLVKIKSFCNDNINFKLQQRMVKCCIWSVILVVNSTG